MVNDRGQLYTMEGVAAGVIMLLTAYIVISTTSVYTAGDTHIPDMQLEQLGSDVLAMMDTPDREGTKSDLETFIGTNDGTGFNSTFLGYCNAKAIGADNLHMSANVTYRHASSNEIRDYPLVEPDNTWTGRESAVRVTRWVELEGNPSGVSGMDPSRPRAVLVEVLLWRA